MQLKPKHQPYKLGRQWQELLLRFTDAPDDDVAMGQCCSACASLARGPLADGATLTAGRAGISLRGGEPRIGWAGGNSEHLEISHTPPSLDGSGVS